MWRKEKGVGTASDGCRSMPLKSTVRASSLGGVPVFSRPSRKPCASSVCARDPVRAGTGRTHPCFHQFPPPRPTGNRMTRALGRLLMESMAQSDISFACTCKNVSSNLGKRLKEHDVPAAFAAVSSAASVAVASARRAPAAAAAAAPEGMRPAGWLWLPMWMVPLRNVPVVITTLLHNTDSPGEPQHHAQMIRVCLHASCSSGHA